MKKRILAALLTLATCIGTGFPGTDVPGIPSAVAAADVTYPDTDTETVTKDLVLPDPVYMAQEAQKAGIARGKNWTVAIYLCGTDLETVDGNASIDLSEMLRAKIPADANVIALTGGTKTWHSSDEEGYVTPSDETTQIYQITDDKMHLIFDYGQYLDLSDSDVTRNFLEFAEAYAPADHMMVDFWDHGGGPIDGAEFAQDRNGEGSYGITMPDLLWALDKAVKYRDGKKFDIIGFDCCLMNSVEVAYELSSVSDFMIASQECEPASGWNYIWMDVLDYDTFRSEDTVGQVYMLSDWLIHYYSGEDYYDDAEKKWISDPTFRGNTQALVDLSKMDEVVKAVDAMGETLESLYTNDTKTYLKIARTMTMVPSIYNGKLGMVDSYKLGYAIYEAAGNLGLTTLRDQAYAFMEACGIPGKEPEAGKGQIDYLNDDNTGAVIYRGLTADYAGGNGMSIFWPGHSTVTSTYLDAVRLADDEYDRNSGFYSNELQFGKDAANYVGYLKLMTEKMQGADQSFVTRGKAGSEIGDDPLLFYGTIQTGLTEDMKRIFISSADDDVEKLIYAEAEFSSFDMTGELQYVHGTVPGRYDWNTGTFYADTDQKWMYFGDKFFTSYINDIDGVVTYTIPVYISEDSDEKKYGVNEAVKDSDVSYLIVSEADGKKIVSYITSYYTDRYDKMEITEGSKLTFTPLRLRRSYLMAGDEDEVKEQYLTNDPVTVESKAGENGDYYYPFDASETAAEEELMAYSFVAYDAYLYPITSEGVYIQSVYTEDISIQDIPDQTYTGSEIKPTLKYVYGNASSEDDELSAEKLYELYGVKTVETFSNNIKAGQATVHVDFMDEDGTLLGFLEKHFNIVDPASEKDTKTTTGSAADVTPSGSSKSSSGSGSSTGTTTVVKNPDGSKTVTKTIKSGNTTTTTATTTSADGSTEVTKTVTRSDGSGSFTCTRTSSKGAITKTEAVMAKGGQITEVAVTTENAGKTAKEIVSYTAASQSTLTLASLDTTKKSVDIPATVTVGSKTFKVTAIAKNALSGNKSITKVTIGKNVRKIGANAFKGDSNLKTIAIKGRLTSVGKNALKSISKKAKITIKAGKSNYKKIKKAIKKQSGLPATARFGRVAK